MRKLLFKNKEKFKRIQTAGENINFNIKNHKRAQFFLKEIKIPVAKGWFHLVSVEEICFIENSLFCYNNYIEKYWLNRSETNANSRLIATEVIVNFHVTKSIGKLVVCENNDAHVLMLSVGDQV